MLPLPDLLCPDRSYPDGTNNKDLLHIKQIVKKILYRS